MDEKLVYYYLYNEEASLKLDICPHLLNIPFLILYKTTYLFI